MNTTNILKIYHGALVSPSFILSLCNYKDFQSRWESCILNQQRWVTIFQLQVFFHMSDHLERQTLDLQFKWLSFNKVIQLAIAFNWKHTLLQRKDYQWTEGCISEGGDEREECLPCKLSSAIPKIKIWGLEPHPFEKNIGLHVLSLRLCQVWKLCCASLEPEMGLNFKNSNSSFLWLELAWTKKTTLKEREREDVNLYLHLYTALTAHIRVVLLPPLLLRLSRFHNSWCVRVRGCASEWDFLGAEIFALVKKKLLQACPERRFFCAMLKEP